MSNPLSLPDDFQGVVRLFPLPNVVLFPQVALPLHMFEARYRQITQDALDDDRLIALALLKPGYEKNYEGTPDLYETVCIGRIIHDETTPDGKYNIVLYGVCRARILEEISSDRLYRMARVEVIDEETTGLDTGTAREWSEHLSGLLRTVLPNRPLPSDASLGTLLDLFAALLLPEPSLKQKILEIPSVQARLQLLMELLKDSPIIRHPPTPRTALSDKPPLN